MGNLSDGIKLKITKNGIFLCEGINLQAVGTFGGDWVELKSWRGIPPIKLLGPQPLWAAQTLLINLSALVRMRFVQQYTQSKPAHTFRPTLPKTNSLALACTASSHAITLIEF
jgi:hypothetical protein